MNLLGKVTEVVVGKGKGTAENVPRRRRSLPNHVKPRSRYLVGKLLMIAVKRRTMRLKIAATMRSNGQGKYNG